MNSNYKSWYPRTDVGYDFEINFFNMGRFYLKYLFIFSNLFLKVSSNFKLSKSNFNKNLFFVKLHTIPSLALKINFLYKT